MADKKKNDQSNSRTLLLVAGAVCLALVVFFVYTKPKMNARNEASAKVKELQTTLERTEKDFGRYADDPGLVSNIIENVRTLDSVLPFKNSPTPSEDYALDVMEPISRAAAQVGLAFPELKAASVTESETIPGLFFADLGLNVVAPPAKLNEFLSALDAMTCDSSGTQDPVGCHPTIKNLTMAAVRVENQENDVSNMVNSSNLNIDFRLQMWFTTDPSIKALIDPAFKLLVIEQDQ